jgi:DNA processing protein
MESKARYFLQASEVFSPKEQLGLLEQFGSAEVLLQKSDWLEQIERSKCELWLRRIERLESSHSFEHLISSGVKFCLRESESYPRSLDHVDTPPHLLYIKGNLPEHQLCGLSIIGTRMPTLYGRQMAQYFASELAGMGFVIVSGAARGIDTVALKSALDVGGPVLGILGTGIDRVYPPENKDLFSKIEKQGALISEFPPGAKPLRHHFPWRNRLISGWALGLLVVEAKIKSGTAVTVRWALDQGRDIFCIPGPVNSEFSRGPHRMIREGAHLVERPQELGEFYERVLAAHLREVQQKELGCLDPDENHLGLIMEPRDIEELMEITGLNISELTSKLNREVMLGKAQKCAGNRYALI